MSHYSALCIASLLAVVTADCNDAFNKYSVACLNALKCADYKTGACGPAVAKVRQECASSALDKLKIQSVDKVFNAVCKTSGGTTAGDPRKICSPELEEYHKKCGKVYNCAGYTKPGECKPAYDAIRKRVLGPNGDDCKSIVKIIDSTVGILCGNAYVKLADEILKKEKEEQAKRSTTRPGTGGTSVVTKPPSGGDVCAAARGAVRL